MSRGRHDTPSVSFSHFNNFLPPPPPPPFGTEFNIQGLRLRINVTDFDLLPVQYAHKNSNVRVYIKSAITNQKPFSSCLVLGVLVPRQWFQTWSWSLGAALWLSTASEQLGWVKCRRLISPQRIIKYYLITSLIISQSHSPYPLQFCPPTHPCSEL